MAKRAGGPKPRADNRDEDWQFWTPCCRRLSWTMKGFLSFFSESMNSMFDWGRKSFSDICKQLFESEVWIWDMSIKGLNFTILAGVEKILTPAIQVYVGCYHIVFYRMIIFHYLWKICQILFLFYFARISCFRGLLKCTNISWQSLFFCLAPRARST